MVRPTPAVSQIRTYTATVTFEGQTYTNTKTETIPATGHKWNGGVVTTEPDCIHNGVRTFTCSQCKDTYTEEITALGHNMIIHDGAGETCTTTGNKPYCECTRCGNYYIDDMGENLIEDKTDVILPASGHNYGEPSWSWNGYTSASAELICSSCDEKHTENAVITSKITKAASCGVTGERTYTAKVIVDGKEYTDSKTESIPGTVHSYKTTTTKATLNANGSIVTKCTVCGEIKSKKTIYKPKTFTLSSTSYTYSGSAKKPTVTVTDSNGSKIASGNYTLSYKDNTKVGKATVTVKFKGKYSGSKSLTFKINPKGTTISKLTPKKAKIALTWKSQTTQTTGYQIQYSKKSDFSGAKTVSITSSLTTAKTISSLTVKTKYYVRIRTYKKVSSVNYYSDWSKSFTVTTK